MLPDSNRPLSVALDHPRPRGTDSSPPVSPNIPKTRGPHPSNPKIAPPVGGAYSRSLRSGQNRDEGLVIPAPFLESNPRSASSSPDFQSTAITRTPLDRTILVAEVVISLRCQHQREFRWTAPFWSETATDVLGKTEGFEPCLPVGLLCLLRGSPRRSRYQLLEVTLSVANRFPPLPSYYAVGPESSENC